MNVDTIKEWMSPKEASSMFGVSTATLRRWNKEGKIQARRTSGGQRRYDTTSQVVSLQNNTNNFITSKSKSNNKQSQTTEDRIGPKGAIYCRVSSNKQRDDLQRQIECLENQYPTYEVFSDIASGLNYKRKGLKRLLERVQKGDINEVVVAHKDRLARFGSEIIEWIISSGGANLIVQNTQIRNPEQELTEDLMAIVHVFSCRFNGKRRYKTTQHARKKRKVGSIQEGQGRGNQSPPQGSLCRRSNLPTKNRLPPLIHHRKTRRSRRPPLHRAPLPDNFM